ncbi:MAG: hypothetical protein R6U96_04740 [Promethearchaeia archaeon]
MEKSEQIVNSLIFMKKYNDQIYDETIKNKINEGNIRIKNKINK